MRDLNGTKVFGKYAEVFAQTEYEDIGWTEYYQAFKHMQMVGNIEDELPGLDEKRRR